MAICARFRGSRAGRCVRVAFKPVGARVHVRGARAQIPSQKRAARTLLACFCCCEFILIVLKEGLVVYLVEALSITSLGCDFDV